MPGNDANTVSLLHMDGADGSSTFTDSAAGGSHAWTRSGAAQIDTAQSKFGGASGLFDGTGDYISTGDSADWNLGAGDWTFDFWIRFASTGVYQCIFEQYADTTHYLAVEYYTDKTIRFFCYSAGYIAYFYSAVLTISTNTWYHFAIVRNGNTPLIFQDGVSKAVTESTTISGKTLPDFAGTVRIAASQYPGYEYGVNGWIDEFRLSKGIARWTANFDVPTEAYGQALSKSLSDSISLAESTAKAPLSIRDDTISLADAVKKALSSHPTDSISLSDATAKKTTLNKADVVSLADALIKTFGLLSLTDTLSLADVFDYIYTPGGEAWVKSLADNLSLSDSMQKFCTINRADAILLADAIVQKFLALYKTDQINLADQISKYKKLYLSDSISLADAIGEFILLFSRILNYSYLGGLFNASTMPKDIPGSYEFNMDQGHTSPETEPCDSADDIKYDPNLR